MNEDFQEQYPDRRLQIVDGGILDTLRIDSQAVPFLPL